MESNVTQGWLQFSALGRSNVRTARIGLDRIRGTDAKRCEESSFLAFGSNFYFYIRAWCCKHRFLRNTVKKVFPFLSPFFFPSLVRHSEK